VSSIVQARCHCPNLPCAFKTYIEPKNNKKLLVKCNFKTKHIHRAQTMRLGPFLSSFGLVFVVAACGGSGDSGKSPSVSYFKRGRGQGRGGQGKGG
jgi:hypothetical protein